MASDRQRVEGLQAGREDSRRIRRHLEHLIDEMLSTAAAHARGNERVLSIATVPDPEHLEEPVNSL